MGACATKFSVLKDAGEAPAPAPELLSKELTAAELDAKKEAVTDGDEASRQSLGNLLMGNQVKKYTSDW